MKARQPISAKVRGLRQRRRTDGNWRVWWEPGEAERSAGLRPVDLDAQRPTWCVRRCEELNALAAAACGRQPAGAPHRRRRSRTIDDLIADYRKQPQWNGSLRPATRRDYDGAFRVISAAWGGWDVTDISRAVCKEWYARLYREAGPWQAASILRKLRLLMSHAVDIEWRADNPALNLRLVKPPARSRVVEWTEFQALVEAAREIGMHGVATAVVLAFFTGQRLTDILAARASDIRDSYWRLVRSKRRNHGAILIHPAALDVLRPLLDAEEPDRWIVLNRSGKPYPMTSFPQDFATVRAHAARRLPSVATVQFRDLRRSFAHWARLGGASERDVADALGNSAFTDPEISGTYMPASTETAARAVRAMTPPGNRKRPK